MIKDTKHQLATRGGILLLALGLLPTASIAHESGAEHIHIAPGIAIPTYGILLGLMMIGLAFVALALPNRLRVVPICLACILIAPAISSAHHVMDTNKHPFLGGLSLPIHGLDHILAMVTVGLWVVAGDKKKRWIFPTSFLGFMIVGMILGFVGLNIPMVETGIWVSVVAFGVMIAMLGRMPNAVVAVLIGLFGIFHGYACGADLPNAWSPWPYGAGLVLCTVALIGVGLLVGTILARVSPKSGIRVAGACTASAMIGALVAPLLSA